MLHPTIYSFLFFLSTLSVALAVSVPVGKIPPSGPPIRIHTYTNPATTSECNLECRRAFCVSVSQFLESVTCTSHRPCLSLVLQYQIQEKCLNWRPEVHASSTATIDGAAKSKIDATSRSKGVTDQGCTEAGPASPQAEWVKPYVPVAEVHAWEVEDARLMSVAEEAHGDGSGGGVSFIVVLRWLCFVGVAVALCYAWQVRDRKEKSKEIVDRRVKGKGEM